MDNRRICLLVNTIDTFCVTTGAEGGSRIFLRRVVPDPDLEIREARSFRPPRRGGGGGGGRWSPPLEFLMCCSISKQWKAFDLLNRMRYIINRWWRSWRPMTSPTMVAILAAILDFAEN